MPTVVQVEEQIYACEGFRVRLTPLKPSAKLLPAYDFLVMAPQSWRISEWKTVRLRGYLTVVRSVLVLRGDESPVKTDLRLGNLRDSYYQAKYGTLAAEAMTGILSVAEGGSNASGGAKSVGRGEE
jgi:hypothetical protein